MLPDAPAGFSTTTGRPSVTAIRSASTRPIVSVGPPAGNGTIMVMARDGYDWAAAPVVLPRMAAMISASFTMGLSSRKQSRWRAKWEIAGIVLFPLYPSIPDPQVALIATFDRTTLVVQLATGIAQTDNEISKCR